MPSLAGAGAAAMATMAVRAVAAGAAALTAAAMATNAVAAANLRTGMLPRGAAPDPAPEEGEKKPDEKDGS